MLIGLGEMKKHFILILILISCYDKEPKVSIPKYPDPEHLSMAGQARILFSIDSVRFIYDSLEYDTKGRLIKSKNNRIWRQPEIIYLYDSNNYPIRFFHRSSLIDNLQYSYKLIGDTLFQYVFSSKLGYFSKNDTTFDFNKPSEVNYYLMNDGLISEFIKESGLMTTFHYDSSKRIIKAASHKDDYSTSVFYYYEENGLSLRSEIFLVESDTVHIKRYNQGVLYSVEKGFSFNNSETHSIYYTSINPK